MEQAAARSGLFHPTKTGQHVKEVASVTRKSVQELENSSLACIKLDTSAISSYFSLNQHYRDQVRCR